MSKEDVPGGPPAAGTGAEKEAATEMLKPDAGLLPQVVKKIRNEPFLFVIALAALLIGLVVQGTGLASADLRFFITVIALLALVVIAGYYLVEGWKLYSESQGEPAAQSAPGESSIRGRAQADELSDDAHIAGVRAKKGLGDYRGQIEGEAEVGKAKGRSSAIGVDIGGDGEE